MPFLTASDLERWVLLLPALVVGSGLVLGVLILLGRAFSATIRESGHPRLILAGAAGLVGAIVLLTYLGVELPRE
ncbi:MAG TPA: hypothetical protein VGC78_08750 [Gaiellaceae bacterium]|jgi:hypothetical protein